MFDIWFPYSDFQEQEEENGERMNQTAEYRSTIFEARSGLLIVALYENQTRFHRSPIR